MKKLISILLIILSYYTVQSQTDSTEYNTYGQAYGEDFGAAISTYKKLIMIDYTNPRIFYEIGFCYLNSPGKEDSSIMYFNNAMNLYKDVHAKEVDIKEIKFSLARAYRIAKQFDSAIIILEFLKKEITDKKFLLSVNQELDYTLRAMNLYSKGKKIKIDNLGKNINSLYSEHSPVYDPISNTLYFTSRKQIEISDIYQDDGQYDEDIYSANYVDSNWTESVQIPGGVNTQRNESTIGISPDGKTLYLYKDVHYGDIYFSTLQNGLWSTPLPLPGRVNSRFFRETDVSLTADGKTMYFTSNRFGGSGGMDIYESKLLSNGKWSRPKNLGDAINSKGDEVGPMISKDGEMMYFSSNAHKGFGGYDIYRSYKNEFGTFTMGENIGYPINTIEDDVFFYPLDSTQAFFCSRRDGGQGKLDLYVLNISYRRQDSITVMTSYIKGCEQEVPNTVVNIKNNNTGQKLVAKPNEKGKFTFIAYKGNNYSLTINFNDEDIYYDNFDIPLDAKFEEEFQAIDLSQLLKCH